MNELWLLIIVILTPTEDLVFRMEGHDTINQCFEHRELLLENTTLEVEEPEKSSLKIYCVKNPEGDSE